MREKKEKEKLKENEQTKKILKIAIDQNKYDIIEDVGKRMANITVGQLLELNPKLRAELSKAIKLTTIEDTSENVLILSTETPTKNKFDINSSNENYIFIIL